MLNKSTTDKKLKSGVIGLHKRWVLGENREGRIEKDSVKEYELTRSLFENGNRVLKEKIKTNSKNHKEKNARILQDNVSLIDEINRLKMEKHLLSQKIKETGTTIAQLTSGVGMPKMKSRAKSARIGGPKTTDHTVMEMK